MILMGPFQIDIYHSSMKNCPLPIISKELKEIVNFITWLNKSLKFSRKQLTVTLKSPTRNIFIMLQEHTIAKGLDPQTPYSLPVTHPLPFFLLAHGHWVTERAFLPNSPKAAVIKQPQGGMHPAVILEYYWTGWWQEGWMERWKKDGIHYTEDKWEKKKGNSKPSKDLQGVKCCVHLVQVVCKAWAEPATGTAGPSQKGNSLHKGVPTKKINNPELQD